MLAAAEVGYGVSRMQVVVDGRKLVPRNTVRQIALHGGSVEESRLTDRVRMIRDKSLSQRGAQAVTGDGKVARVIFCPLVAFGFVLIVLVFADGQLPIDPLSQVGSDEILRELGTRFGAAKDRIDSAVAGFVFAQNRLHAGLAVVDMVEVLKAVGRQLLAEIGIAPHPHGIHIALTFVTY